jgi:hypothetical protein
MIVVTIKDDGEDERELEEMARRCETLGEKSNEVRAAIVGANEAVNFDPNNNYSILEVNADGSGAVGARHPRGSYADLLAIPDRVIANIFYHYIVDGE